MYNNARLNNYLYAATKYAGEDESSKKDKKEDKAEAGEQDQQAQAQQQQQAMPPQAPPMAMAQAPAMPTNPIDVMGQGLQQATTGLNQIIDSFYALQGGGPQQAPMPAGAPQASSVPGAPQGQPQASPAGQPAGMQVQSAQAPAANPQKSAFEEMTGRYGGDGHGSGSTYYNYLRARVQKSQAILAGPSPVSGPTQPGQSPSTNMI